MRRGGMREGDDEDGKTKQERRGEGGVAKERGGVEQKWIKERERASIEGGGDTGNEWG